MKRDAAARKFDRLLVWKVSRLGRDMRELISTVYELADLGVTVVPVKSQTGPISSTMGKLLWAIQAWYAEMEIRKSQRPSKPAKPWRAQRASTWADLQRCSIVTWWSGSVIRNTCRGPNRAPDGSRG
jgi:DNA invertase Pin-like site-specific DNA recombinase